jgi:hypothetical protein
MEDLSQPEFKLDGAKHRERLDLLPLSSLNSSDQKPLVLTYTLLNVDHERYHNLGNFHN